MFPALHTPATDEEIPPLPDDASVYIPPPPNTGDFTKLNTPTAVPTIPKKPDEDA